MKTALVTTTINVPHVLRLYRRCDPDVRFFVAADKKTPRLNEFCNEIGNASVFLDGDLGEWKCSDLLGWNTIARRNIATLEALKWGADLIVFVDDDNIPTNTRYFSDYERALAPYPQSIRGTWKIGGPHSGLLASPEVDWFDVGAFLDPPASHRGFPHELAHCKPRLSHVVDARIGAVAGIVMGDPDVSAITRIARAPHVLNVSPLLNAGIAVNPCFTRTVWNTQNSAIIRELAPAMLLCPQLKRYDDIAASIVTQRCMATTGHHILFSHPFVYQERHAHNLTRDLEDEMWGTRHFKNFAEYLFHSPILDKKLAACTTVLDKVRAIYDDMRGNVDIPDGVSDLAMAWCEDLEKVL